MALRLWRRLKHGRQKLSTHYNSHVYRTYPHGYNFFVQFYPHGLDSAAGNHTSIMFALFPGNSDGLLTWPLPEAIHISVRDQLDPQEKWTITIAPSEKISFRRPTREPLPTLMTFKFFPHTKMFSKTENFLFNNTLYLEIKFTDLPDHRAPHLSHFDHHFLEPPNQFPPNQFSILLTPVSCRVIANV